jgi:imidazolonepropionase
LGADLAREIVSANGALITPGLIDCHTHLVFAGDRSAEFEARLKGASYADIARSGGGILSTVKATREATLGELITLAATRMRAMVRQGVTTIEFKSGYGLDAANEMKMLEAGTRAAAEAGVRPRRTFLGLHALPPEYGDDRRAYVRHVASDMLDMAVRRGLVDAVDAFCEGIGFTLEETRMLFDAARKHGLPVKLHAEQLSDLGGTGLAAQYSALSADHLEYANAEGVAAMGRSGTVAVLLPGAFYFLKETKKPPVDLLRKLKVAVAVATDFNPGSSPLASPTLAMNMACTLFGLTPEESLAGMTRNAAAALGLEHETGTLAVGKAADLALWDIESPGELSYWVGGLAPERVMIAGRDIQGTTI